MADFFLGMAVGGAILLIAVGLFFAFRALHRNLITWNRYDN